MKTIYRSLPMSQREVHIVPLADLHLGDSQCDLELVKSVIKSIADNDNCYCILNGDIINNSTKTSVGDVYSEKLPPMKQLELAVSLFEPIKNKILAITNGNHENRTYRTDGIDLMGFFALKLGLEKVYSSESVLLFLGVGSNHGLTRRGTGQQYNFSLHIAHGAGGGAKEGGKVNRLSDMASIVDADIYIHSHTHLPVIMKQAFYRANVDTHTVKLVDKLFVNTNAFLNYGGYGETYGFKPASKDVPVITLWGSSHEKHMSARL